jgi:hypothetical protein
LVDSSPRPIAASHVLHRLLVPRHPPFALDNLTKNRPTPQQVQTQNTTHANNNSTHKTNPTKGRANIAEKQDALASTIHISTNNQPQPHPRTPAQAEPERFERKEVIGPKKTMPRHPAGPTPACSLRYPTGCSSSAPAAPTTVPHPPQGRAVLDGRPLPVKTTPVSPPLSPRVDIRHARGPAPLSQGRCSLERR